MLVLMLVGNEAGNRASSMLIPDRRYPIQPSD
jgi:hypothetical protein